MGKDKHTFTQLSKDEQAFYKELEKRCENDCNDVLQIGGLIIDYCRECWFKGFQYAGERIERIFELTNDGVEQ